MDINMHSYFDSIQGGECRTQNNLQLIPLFLNTAVHDRDYLLLDEAMEEETLQVSEATEAGSVNTLSIINLGVRPVLILDGEELVGAKQNRMVNATMLIPAQGKMDIPVSCVERGRWRYDSSHFSRSEVHGYAELRRKKAAAVSRNLQMGMPFVADQGEVWQEIDRKHASMGFHSQTDAMHDVYHKFQKELNDFIFGLKQEENQTGVAVFINGKFICMDMFSHPDVLGKLWNKLLKSYAMEALEQQQIESNQTRAAIIEPLLSSLNTAEFKQYPSVGLGTDIRLKNSAHIGSGLVYKENVLHLAAFHNAEQNRSDSHLASPNRRRRAQRNFDN